MVYSIIEKLNTLRKDGFGSTANAISNVIVDNLDTIKILSIIDVARMANCSKSTVTQFCKKLQIKGYKELVSMVTYEYRIYSTNQGNSRFEGSTNDLRKTQMLYDYKSILVENINFIHDNSASSIIRACEMTNRVQKIFLFGKGANINVLNIFSNYLMKLGYFVFYSNDIDVQFKLADTISENDGCFIFSYSGITPEIIDIYEKADKHQSSIVLLTSNRNSVIYNEKNINILVLHNEEMLVNQRNAYVSFITIISELIFLLNSK